MTGIRARSRRRSDNCQNEQERAGRVNDAPKRSRKIKRRSDRYLSMSFFANRPTFGMFSNSPGLATLSVLRSKSAGAVFTVTMNLSGYRRRAFQQTVVGFVADDTELGEQIAHEEALDDFSDKFRVSPRTSAYSSRIARLTPPRVPWEASNAIDPRAAANEDAQTGVRDSIADCNACL